MSMKKLKSRPPPLHLLHLNNEEDCETGFISIAESPLNQAVTEEYSEFYPQFEDTLNNLLLQEELIPFNLHTAASLGITTSVRHLIERCNVDPNSRNSGNWTAIMYASLFSHTETLLYLLEMKADVNAKNPNGRTPLMLASVCGSDETIKILLLHGALLEERDHEQFTALMMAIASTHCESANLLLDHGADPNVREEIYGQTPLYIAAQTGQVGIARALIQRGVDVDVRTSSGDSAHHAALRNGYTPIANMIMEKLQAVKTEDAVTVYNSNAKASKPSKPNQLTLAPTQYRPKSPYSAFFARFPDPVIPKVIVENVDVSSPAEAKWFPSPGDITRCSPEGVEESVTGDGFNLFSAWPGASMILKQAVPAVSHFQRSITKPVMKTNIAKTPVDPWSPIDERSPAVGNSNINSGKNFVKLPKDLSSVLTDLGLTKYQMHFEEQDIDLQVFLTMNETDLREIGINSLGARRKCLSTIEYYQVRSDYYRISEEFMVNTSVSKRDLVDLKLAWSELAQAIADLRGGGRSPSQIYERLPHIIDRLVKQMKRAETFFLKY